MSRDHYRVRFNELVNVLRTLDALSLAEASAQFPAFAVEVDRGPDAGGEDVEYEAAIQRAQFSEELCSGIIFAGQNATEKVLTHASSLSRSRVAVALIGGILGATLLGAIGLVKDDVARISGIATAIVAVLNATLDIYAKRYSAAEVQKSVELRHAIGRLRVSHNALRAAIRARVQQKDLAVVSEQCNEQALAVGRSVDLLRVV